MRRLLAALATAVLLVAGMSVLPAQAAERAATVLTFKGELGRVSTNVKQYGDLLYGVTALQGASLVNGDPVVIDRFATVEYDDANGGPIGGFLTVTWQDGSHLSMRVSGTAVTTPDTADFTAALAVFSASGQWKGYVGSGVMRGLRTGAVGGPVVYSYRLNLRKG
jgi:hypothetical protein